MVKLLSNEFYKIFHKKNIKIVLLIALVFCLVINFYYKSNKADVNYLNTAQINILNCEENLQNGTLSSIEQEECLKNNTLNKYIIKNNRNLNANTLNKMFELFYDNYWLFILIIAIMFSASALGDEYNQSTLKNLLTAPYKRSIILLAKYLSHLGVVLLFLLFLIVIQLFIGHLIFQDNSLKLPIVLYNYQLHKIVEYNVFKFIILKGLTLLPQLILIYSITFLISIILKNPSTTNIVMYVFITFSELLNAFLTKFDCKIWRLVLTVNWDFGYLLTKQQTMYKFISLPSSIIVCLCYFIIILYLSIKFFNKNDVKT